MELDALKALRERLLGLLFQFPELKEVIELLERLIREKEDKGKVDLRLLKPDETPVTTPPNPTIQPGGGITGNNTALTLAPTPCLSDEILIRGTASIERDFVQYDADVDIELQLSSCNDEGINKVTPVKGGSVKFVTPLGKIFGVIDGSQDSKIVMGPGGTGTIELWITFQPDADPWLNQIHGTNYVKLPIKANAARELVIDIDWSYLRQAFPRPYSKLADFNLDGALTTADYAAFLADYNIQGVRADATVDGVWNQSDIDKFWEDFNYEQSVPR